MVDVVLPEAHGEDFGFEAFAVTSFAGLVDDVGFEFLFLQFGGTFLVLPFEDVDCTDIFAVVAVSSAVAGVVGKEDGFGTTVKDDVLLFGGEFVPGGLNLEVVSESETVRRER